MPNIIHTDLYRAGCAFVAHLSRQYLAHERDHAIMVQNIKNNETGAVEQRIAIHWHPNSKLRDVELPDSFNGFPVVKLEWPIQDL